MSVGVYVLYFNSGDIYIGSTENLFERIYEHSKPNKKWNFSDLKKIKYKICKKSGFHLMLEYMLIKKIRPSLNSQYIHSVRQNDKKKYIHNLNAQKILNIKLKNKEKVQKYRDKLREKEWNSF